ncbi:MAG TPA: hypothetical protein VLE51_02350 [Candidatus Saccharimonadales bacterium]|nr:hypothetical protein [Candidatus Saccharimonadales bacterium]
MSSSSIELDDFTVGESSQKEVGLGVSIAAFIIVEALKIPDRVTDLVTNLRNRPGILAKAIGGDRPQLVLDRHLAASREEGYNEGLLV